MAGGAKCASATDFYPTSPRWLSLPLVLSGQAAWHVELKPVPLEGKIGFDTAFKARPTQPAYYARRAKPLSAGLIDQPANDIKL